MKNIVPVIMIAFLASCSNKTDHKSAVVNPDDYKQYLTASSEVEILNLKKECEFWSEKLAKEPGGFTYLQKLGAANSMLFEKTGDVNYLHEAENLFEAAKKQAKGKRKVGNLLTLSSLAIKKHNFEQANQYALLANELTDEKFGVLLMQFDSEMELGNYELAESILKRNKRMDSFDYLVRLSKFKDYEGNLDSAIIYMEKAQKLVSTENSKRAIWAEASLGDMYGHAGRIAKSYQKYLSVLEKNPTYHYALKGIAWIAYSADRNMDEAKRILNVINENTQLPDVGLLQANIARSDGEEEKALELIRAFLVQAQQEKYGNMYNKYLITLFAEELSDFDEAIRLSMMEVEARPTPATYDWLAWSYFLKGEKGKALGIYAEYVDGRTQEPDVLYHMGTVYSQSNREGGKDLLKQALDSSYELGPLVSAKIRKQLKS